MKSREEILTPLRGTGKYYHCVDYEDALKAMEEYASQQAQASTPPVSAMYSKELCEWVSGRYTFLYGRWVINNEIYKHGSESHFERVSKEHGITFDELIKKYNENDNTSNRVPT